jgi:sigma-E factor negative regulatory protein RseB
VNSVSARFYCIFAVFLLALVSHQVSAQNCTDADPAALEWLNKMSRSSHEVSYRGVVTFQRGDDMQVMQVSHSVANGSASESLTQLTGQGAQVVRVDHPLHCVHPGHKLLQIGDQLQAGNCGISAHYRFSVGEGERIAGRKAVRILVQPKDMYRHGYVMELDQKTGLLLKMQTVGRGQKILEKFQFADLSFTDEVAATSDAETIHQAIHPNPVQDPAVLLAGGWDVRWIPAGFTVTDSSEGDLSRRTYTDGLAVFSVFLERLSTQIKPGEGVVRRGGTLSYTRGMSMSDAPVLVTVIGEVPLNTARMVADSIRGIQ